MSVMVMQQRSSDPSAVARDQCYHAAAARAADDCGMAQRTELGAALRAWRDRVRPEEVGLRGGGRRRSPGLRREELAGLAGVSVDYLVRLEQGRASNPSAQVLASLARA